MKKWIWVLAIFVILVGISSDQGSTESSKNSKKDSPRLVLSASPRQGLSPHHVAINARLEGVSDHDQDWYCLKEEWDFGDGVIRTLLIQKSPRNFLLTILTKTKVITQSALRLEKTN